MGRSALEQFLAPENRHLAFLGPKCTKFGPEPWSYGCQSSVPKSLILRQCRRPISLLTRITMCYEIYFILPYFAIIEIVTFFLYFAFMECSGTPSLITVTGAVKPGHPILHFNNH